MRVLGYISIVAEDETYHRYGSLQQEVALVACLDIEVAAWVHVVGDTIRLHLVPVTKQRHRVCAETVGSILRCEVPLLIVQEEACGKCQCCLLVEVVLGLRVVGVAQQRD